MKTVDRVAVLLKPTSLMLYWVNLVTGQKLTLAELQLDCTLLLLPKFEEAHSAEQHLNLIYENIFAKELQQWTEETQLWPENRDLDTFLTWFDLEFHARVYDTQPAENF